MNFEKNFRKILDRRDLERKKYLQTNRLLILLITLLIGIFVGDIFSNNNIILTGFTTGNLPDVGESNWGTILNNYLLQEHTTNGTHGNVTVEGNLTVENNLTVSGKSNFNGDVNISGNLTVQNGTNIYAERPCAINFTRVGLWCMATNYTRLRAPITADENSWTVSQVDSSARMVILSVYINAWDSVDGFNVVSCATFPEDSYDCGVPGSDNIQVQAYSNTGAGSATDTNTVIIQTNSTGHIKTWCNVVNDAQSLDCEWNVKGYID